MTIRMLIADDHELIREGLRYALAETVEIVAETSSGKETVTRAAQGDWDVMLLDINMPDGDGFDVLREIGATTQLPQADLPASPNQGAIRTGIGNVLIFSRHDRADFQVRARELGAHGFLHKSASRQDLLTAIQRVAEGEMVWEVPDF